MLINKIRMREVEYYRCWPGNQGDSGQWDTDFIYIPADTPDDKLNEAVQAAAEKIKWREEPPCIVGLYCSMDDAEELDEEDP